MSDQFEEILTERWAGSTDSAHDIAHIHRVWKTVQQIAAVEGGDLSVLRPATVFHDLINLPKDAADRHLASARSAAAAAEILRDLGHEAPLIDAVSHAITAHSYSADVPPQTLEAEILQDADRIDALGAIGICRTMAISGALGRAIYDAADPFAQHRAPDDGRNTLDHFPIKLLQLAEGMNTATGREIATERTAFMRAFLDQLSTEI